VGNVKPYVSSKIYDAFEQMKQQKESELTKKNILKMQKIVRDHRRVIDGET